MKHNNKLFIIGVAILLIGTTSCGNTSSSSTDIISNSAISSISTISSVNTESSDKTESSKESLSSESVESSVKSEVSSVESVSSEESISSSTPTEKSYVRVNEENRPTENGGYILFGSYPQRYVKNEAIIEALNGITEVNSLGYIEYDGEQYVKATAKLYLPADYYTFVDNTRIEDGKDYYFKVQPIKWKILNPSAKEGERAFLLSESVLMNKAFQSRYRSEMNEKDGLNYWYNDSLPEPSHIYANNYEYSELRSWLNKDFYQKVFSDKEKEIIQTTDVDNSLESTDDEVNEFVCNDTKDKVFLLSHKEVSDETYDFTSSDLTVGKRVKHGTDYAKVSGLLVAYNKVSNWWLRSPDKDYLGRKAYYMYALGSSVNKSDDVTYNNAGIAPAINITL